ncbi:enhancer of polycomb homolog 1-like isoform X1 [Pseudochaenichthys georgianus]|uniref:enhancer of polycomb homolog 1-like isoform X1 n=2 Tax=Pseudochaenichthys georgianus TaxID=52239 RepID=UPI00146AF0D5|nr:enhancer of polycomb homolog 1-like isoform X1 [Pseudochaenichthys georgianus]
MSKLSFRARALDATKPLPVFRCEDLPDLHEYASINRAVPQMPTGMEKEEESEHHLQRAISAQQVYGEKRDNMHIPVPEAESDITYYESLYPGEFKMPKQLIHIQPFSLDAEQPDYDLDSEDDAFVNKLKKKMEISFLQFEEMIDRLEKGSGQQAVSLPEAKLLLKEDDELIKEVFDYWSRKRKTSRANCLIPNCKQERRDGSSTSDPYVAFRRRTEKMQTRKNRKNDESSYEKMLKLRRDLSRAVTILEMIKRREKSKRELLHLTLEIFEKRNVMSDYSGEVMAEVLAERALVRPQIIPLVPVTNQYRHQDHMDLKDYKSKPEKAEVPRQKRKYEKKPKALPLSSGAPHHPGPAVFNAKDLNQYDFPSSDDEPYSQLHSGSSEAEEENDPDGAFAFRRKAGCQYYAVRQDRVGSWPWCGPWDGGLAEARFRYSLTTLTVPRRCLGMARRRMGRGGRVLLDRAHTDYDNVFHDLDAEKFDTSLPPSPPPPAASSRSPASDKFASTSETNTSDRSSSSLSSPSSKDLSQILLNISACRWRHFRPRTLPLHELDNAHPLFRKLSRSLKRPASSPTAAGQPFGSLRPGRVVHAPPPTAAFTAEQYQQHLEQLALMQKLQLEQVQLQLKANSTATTHSTKGLSHTLDQASAQFAASALVTADKLLALKTKEDLGPGGGAVNGVLSPSGVYKGSHLSSTVAPPSSSSPTPSLLHPSATSNNNGTAHHHPNTTNTTQVLLGNNSLRLGVPTGKRVHAPRTLSSTTMSTSALKLAAANCQKPKVTATSASPLDIVPRENHEQEKPALNSLSENTVAMEVT